MGTGIGEYCKRCGEQLNYDDGFENGFCSRCLCIEGFEKGVIKGRFEALPNPKFASEEQRIAWKKLIKGELKTTGQTWESVSSYQAELQGYNDDGIEYYRYVATLDNRTSNN